MLLRLAKEGVDDLDKSASFRLSEAPRRSTPSLGERNLILSSNMQLKISKQRIALALVASVFLILQGMGNLSSGRWSKSTAALFMMVAPVLTFIVAVTVNPARRGIFGSPDERRQATRQFGTTVLLWIVAAATILIGLKVMDWYQAQ